MLPGAPPKTLRSPAELANLSLLAPPALLTTLSAPGAAPTDTAAATTPPPPPLTLPVLLDRVRLAALRTRTRYADFLRSAFPCPAYARSRVRKGGEIQVLACIGATTRKSQIPAPTPHRCVFSPSTLRHHSVLSTRFALRGGLCVESREGEGTISLIDRPTQSEKARSGGWACARGAEHIDGHQAMSRMIAVMLCLACATIRVVGGRDFDKLRTGLITPTQFREGLAMAGLQLTDAEFALLRDAYVDADAVATLRAQQARSAVSTADITPTLRWGRFCDDVDKSPQHAVIEHHVAPPSNHQCSPTCYCTLPRTQPCGGAVFTEKGLESRPSARLEGEPTLRNLKNLALVDPTAAPPSPALAALLAVCYCLSLPHPLLLRLTFSAALL